MNIDKVLADPPAKKGRSRPTRMAAETEHDTGTMNLQAEFPCSGKKLLATHKSKEGEKMLMIDGETNHTTK